MKGNLKAYRFLALGAVVAGAAIGGATWDDEGFGGFLSKRAPSYRPRVDRAYEQAVRKTAAMVGDQDARRFANAHKLDLLNVTWEDTGRYKNSSVGPNISDMTIQVGLDRGRDQVERFLMPVIRFPNFEDKTGEMDPRDFTLLVGNEKGRSLKRASLYDVLADPARYLSDPRSWPLRRNRTLLADRDQKVLVSAQACFLPVPQGGKATFNPVVFNYQSSPGNPAVLTILATREGTSMTVIDNNRDGFDSGWNWGQRLFHNANGQRTSLTGQRLSDFKADGGGQGRGEARVPDYALNMVLLIQVPLKHRERSRAYAMDTMEAAPAAAESAKMGRKSDVEAAVIGHGDEEGPFTEMDSMAVERDPRFPVRVTVQFYKATSNGVVSRGDMDEIARDIGRVYNASTSVGSLVTGGFTGRVTEYDGPKVQPANWWRNFYRQYSAWSGIGPEELRHRLRTMLGKDYEDQQVCELYLRDRLRGYNKG
ncbi:MAG: hypothetical protein KIT11_09035 [Fimbriimonadaceae bacterium]|nr:hypothetical protein [Fimbriimonadaceae bacterium]QYK55472.1 MAG: hypothetical protein KF733_10705 [Fimbriimonadaceae bacterium]